MSIFDHEEVKLLKEILHVLQEIHRDIHRPQVHNFRLFQLKGDMEMSISGIQAGGSGVFQIGLVPPTGVPLQSGPSVSADDTNVTLGPVDASLQFTAAVAAGDTATSFNITVSGVNGAGASISHSFNIPILPAPPVQVTDFSLDQVS